MDVVPDHKADEKLKDRRGVYGGKLRNSRFDPFNDLRVGPLAYLGVDPLGA